MIKNKKIGIVSFAIVLTILLINFASAVPIPLGIDGRVYELDGVTEVFSGIPVIINDTTSNIVIYARTGKGSSGRYSAAINGQIGDQVIVTAYNPVHSTVRNFTMIGVTHNFDLILNMSLPDLAPEIYSEPITSVLEDQPYEYTIDIVEWNQENVLVELVEAPLGITFNQISNSRALLTWTPVESDVGFHNIKISASDANSTSYQDFTLEVINVNDPPEIDSIPVTKATALREYVYEVGVSDPDGPGIQYSLLQKPVNMTITGNKIKWTPSESQIGNHNVILEISDGEFTDSQNYFITVGVNSPPEIISSPVLSVTAGNSYTYVVEGIDADGDSITYSLLQKPESMTLNGNTISWNPGNSKVGTHTVKIQVSDGLKTGTQTYVLRVNEQSTGGTGSEGGSSSGGGGGVIPPDEDDSEDENEDGSDEGEHNDEDDNEDDDSVDVKIENSGKGAKIKKLLKRPFNTKRLDKLVYKYLSIERIEKDKRGKAIINFKVNNKWIQDRKVTNKDIVLSRYTNQWDELPTENTDEDKDHSYYESETPGFSYFAITVKNGVKPQLPEPDVQIIKEPYVIFGKIYDSRNKEVPVGTPYLAENLRTGQILYGETGKPTRGSYQIVAHGAKGDKILFTVFGYYETELEIELIDDKINLDIKADKTGGIIGITGRAISGVTGQGVGKGTVFLAMSFICIIIITAGYGTHRVVTRVPNNKGIEEEVTIEHLVSEASRESSNSENEYNYDDQGRKLP